MNGISDQQRALLRRLAMREMRDMHPGHFAEMLFEFVRTKAEAEPLDPQWIQLWRTQRDHVARYLPPSRFKEIEAAVSAIQPIDPEVWSLRIAETERCVLLLGAGASAPEPSSIPIVGNLLPELWRRARKIGRDDLDRLASWCNARSIRNIEDLLTAAYIANFTAKSGSITALLDYFLFARAAREESEEEILGRRPWRRSATPDIDASSIALLQDTLQTLFGLLTSTMITAKPNAAHSAVARFLEVRPQTRIITTNYDGCMDEALLDGGRDLRGLVGATAHGPGLDDCPLIKMHGSINWSYCDSCQDVRDFSLRDLKDAFENDRLSYAVIGICRTCGGQRRPLLVPPLSFKFMMFPNLVSLWYQAQRSIEAADTIVVVGYSFSEADTYISKMLSRSLAFRSAQRLVVCDTNAALVPSIRERMAAHIEGFDERRILQVVGSCEATLPSLLESLLGRRTEGAASTATAEEGLAVDARPRSG